MPISPVELGLVVVVFHAELDEVPARLGRLPRPELDLDVAHGRLQEDLVDRRSHSSPWENFVFIHVSYSKRSKLKDNTR